MARLKKCPACSREVAKGASACPHCGNRFTSGAVKLLAFIAISFGVIFMMMLFASMRDGGPSASGDVTTQEPQQSALDPAVQSQLDAWHSIQMVSTEIQVVEKNDTWWKFSYVVTVNNPSSETFSALIDLQFKDPEGFALDDDRVAVTVSPGMHRFSDYALIDSDIAHRVEGASTNMTMR